MTTTRNAALAHALRAAADSVERVRRLTLDARVRLDDETYMTLCFDVPTVVQCLADIAGTLDPTGEAGVAPEAAQPAPAGDWGADEPDEPVGELGRAS